MVETALSYIYLAGLVVFLLPLARWMLRHAIDEKEPSTMDYWMAFLLACLLVGFWPLVIPGGWVVHKLRQPSD